MPKPERDVSWHCAIARCSAKQLLEAIPGDGDEKTDHTAWRAYRRMLGCRLPARRLRRLG